LILLKGIILSLDKKRLFMCPNKEMIVIGIVEKGRIGQV
jgi:hypothetical protein